VSARRVPGGVLATKRLAIAPASPTAKASQVASGGVWLHPAALDGTVSLTHARDAGTARAGFSWISGARSEGDAPHDIDGSGAT
jgi:hypothetical protein